MIKTQFYVQYIQSVILEYGVLWLKKLFLITQQGSEYFSPRGAMWEKIIQNCTLLLQKCLLTLLTNTWFLDTVI
jgi:hypothetical protein